MGSMADHVRSSDQSNMNMLTINVACLELTETLENNLATLRLREQDLLWESAKTATALSGQHAEQLRLEEMRRTQSSRLAYLDLPHRERIPQDQIKGQTSFVEKKNYLSIRPKFKFSVTTECPIRFWTRNQSDGVQWDPIICPEAGRQLTATARGKSFARATAEIELYGWRKEVHAAEIIQLRASLKNLEAQLASVAALVKQLRSRDLRTDSAVIAVQIDVKLCEQDLRVIKSKGAKTVTNAQLQACLDAGSVSGYAAVLGLESEVEVSPTGKRTSEDPLLTETMDACQSELLSAKATMDHYCAQRLWALSGAGKSAMTSLDTSLHAAIGTKFDFASLIALLKPSNNGDSELLTLVDECKQDLKAFGVTITAQRKTLTGLLHQLAAGPSGSTDSHLRDPELTAARETLERQVDAMDRTCRWVKGDRQPVGVATALRSTRYQGPGGKVDAFQSVYRGELIRTGV